MHLPTPGRFVAAALATATIVAGSATVVGASAPATPSASATLGGPRGSIVVAAEEEPATADWIHRDAGIAWGVWVLGGQTLPQAFVVQPDGSYAPGVVLAGEPELEPGPPQRVTYRIRDEAVWSDGEPITSKDFAYRSARTRTGSCASWRKLPRVTTTTSTATSTMASRNVTRARP